LAAVKTPADLIPVGKIVSVYGVKGWVKVYSYTDPKENLFDYGPYWLAGREGQEKDLLSIEIDEGRAQGEGLVAHLKGVDDRDEARVFCQREILVAKTALPRLPQGEYYWSDLLGLKVYSSWEGKRSLLGTVKQMLETGANDVMVVKPCEGSVDQRERLLPFIPHQYQTEIDLQAGCLSLEWDPDF